MNHVKFSVSSHQSKRVPKLYTYGFKVATAVSLNDIIGNANRYAISGPKYTVGHRKGENITAGSNIILIDCDEPGQAEAVEAKIRHYDYVKVPSASNSEEKPYKWHFIIPTAESLSVYPAAMQWQVEQFFRQVGINDNMIDTTGSYDIARQFAPASIGMTIEEANDLSEIHHGNMELQAPVSEPPAELCTFAAKSRDINIDGITATDLPSEHLWFKGNAIAYPDAIKAVREAYAARENEEDKIIVSGFGCPNDNHHHTGDRTRGYGFAFVGDGGDVIIKCSGNECKEFPLFVVPEDEVKSNRPEEVYEYDKSSAPQIVLSFEKHWENKLGNISSPALLQNWHNNFDAFDEIISRNINEEHGKKICCPGPTGSGKTQQIAHKAISLHETDVRTLIVTMRTEDADIIASQIKTHTHDSYVAVFHTKEISIQGVRQADNPHSDQCVVITHERFRRMEGSITVNRDFIVIDEAIDVIRHTQINENDLENIIKIAEKFQDFNYDKKDTDRLLSETRMMKKILDIQFKEFKDSGKSFIGLRAGSTPAELDTLPNLKFTEIIKLMDQNKIKPSVVLTGIYNAKMDAALKSKYIGIAENIKYFFRQFNFMARHGMKISWNTASELIPGKSIIIMDATAAVNKAYELYMRYQPERLQVLPAIACRDYSNVTMHQFRTATGRYTILGKNKFDSEKDKTENIKILFENVVKNTESNDEILIVSFTELEPQLLSYAKGIDDRRVHVDHWGNLTGTNKYQHCNKIFIYGLNHKPQEIHRSLHALIKSPAESFKDTDENSREFKNLVRFDIIAEVIQAINRIRCRRVIDDRGNCDIADVFITLPADFGSYRAMIKAIGEEMRNINVVEWDFKERNTNTLERTSFIESFFRQLEVSLTDNTLEISLQDVLEKLDLTREQWRKHIKNKKLFKGALDSSPFYLEKRHRIDRRGRAMKRKEVWFTYGHEN